MGSPASTTPRQLLRRGRPRPAPGLDAANALVDLINGRIHDTCTQMTFGVEMASITINVADVRRRPAPDSGHDNLASDNLLITAIFVRAPADQPVGRLGDLGHLGHTTVQRGEGGPNTSNFTADTTAPRRGHLLVTVKVARRGASDIANLPVTAQADWQERHDDRDAAATRPARSDRGRDRTSGTAVTQRPRRAARPRPLPRRRASARSSRSSAWPRRGARRNAAN